MSRTSVFRLPILAGLYGAGDALIKGGHYLLLIWLGTRFHANEYATLVLAVGVFQLITLILLGGLPEAIYSLMNYSRFKHNASRLFRSARTYQLLLSAIVSIPILIIFYAIESRNKQGMEWHAIPLIYLYSFIMARYSLMVVINQLADNHRQAMLYRYLLPGFGLSFAIIGIIVFGNHYEIYFLGNVCAFFGVYPLLRKLDGNAIDAKTDREVFRDLNRLGIPLILVSLSGWITGLGLTVIVSGVVARSTIAQYGMIISINAALLIAYNSFNQVWVPIFFNKSRDVTGEQLDHVNSAANDLLNLVVINIVVCMYLFSKELFALLKMSDHKDICRYLGIVLVSHCFLFLYYRYVNYYFLSKRNTVFMVEIILSGVLGLAATAALIAAWGDVGVYWGYTITMALRSIMVAAYIIVFFKKKILDYLPVISAVILGGLMLLQAQDTPVSYRVFAILAIGTASGIHATRIWKLLTVQGRSPLLRPDDL